MFTPFCRLPSQSSSIRPKRNEHSQLDNIKEKLSQLEHIADELASSVKVCKHLITEVNGRLLYFGYSAFPLFALFRRTSKRTTTK
jgi:hypothetical protein